MSLFVELQFIGVNFVCRCLRTVVRNVDRSLRVVRNVDRILLFSKSSEQPRFQYPPHDSPMIGIR